MENSEPGTSASSTLGGKVFLSFRGPDTYHTFTRSLYDALDHAGVCVFINDKEIQRGDIISDDFPINDFNDFMLYIPIFSQNYASSPWCLRELVMMVKSYSESKEDGKEKVILPIFYGVEPDDVKLKTPLYKDAILKLKEKKKFDLEVETWQQALRDVRHHKGLNQEKGDDNLIKLVVQGVLARLKIRQRQVTENLVGMKDHKAAIDKILDIDSDSVLIILIYGMGGTGKTTLASIIFNQLCPNFGKYCCFLDDVRERAKTKGLVELQKQLLSDFDSSIVAENFNDIHSGIGRIGDTIRNKKALIVLDDVDAADQIKYLISVNSLYAGTRILVTSRDKSVLNTEEFQDKCKRYEMLPLRDKDALKLFSRRAFGDKSPPANYLTLSEQIVYTMKGLPLALEVIGSSLRGVENKEIWEKQLEELKITPPDDVLGRLRISYNALREIHQRIFLDIACFFIGENKTNPVYMWADCEFLPNDSIDVLTKRCMIKVSHDGRFWMHDHLRDLGRTIATQEHRRLWNKADTIRELKETQDEERVEGLRLSAWRGDITITSEQIKRFPGIRFLSLGNVDCQGDFTDCLEELRWIRLSYGFVSPDEDGVNQRLEATNLLYLANAVVVDLSGLQFDDDVLQNLIQGAWKLKVLVIRANFWISGTPIFPEYSVLEKLIIDDSCISEIDRSIGRLQHLTELSFEGSFRLKKLPKQIGRLRKLRHLSLKSCHHLIKLPESVSELESLTTLDVYGTGIEKLPRSIGGLPRLSFLDLSHAPIAEMPRTTSQLSQLQTLKMFCCDRLQELPMLPRSLTTLVVTSKSLRTLPDLSYLTNLVELVLSDGNHVGGWSGIIQTGELWWIGRLSKLSKLSFRFPTVRAPTTELSSLYQLKELTLQGVNLPTFEQIPSNLTVLELYDAPGKQVHLDGVPQLEKETDNRVKARADGLLECTELQGLGLADHRGGAFLFPRFQKMLKKFHLSGFPGALDIRFVSPFASLEEFSIEKCSSLKSLGGLSYLKNLKRLDIQSCKRLRVIEGIDKLEFLHGLHITKCRSAEVNFDASSSKIPNKCWMYINLSGKLYRNPSNRYYTWEEYREKILNGRKQASDTEMETTHSETETETETGGPLQKTNQESKDKKRKRKRQSAKQQRRRKRRKLQKNAWVHLFHHVISFCISRKTKRRKERARVSVKEREIKKRGKRA